MAPLFVKPYRKDDKNDGPDAEAICEAVQRPNVRFVPVKSPLERLEQPRAPCAVGPVAVLF